MIDSSYENVSGAMMTTIKHVAREAGLSVTTVSRALNNHGDVAEATRAHVQRVASQLGYHPNHTARSLQGTRTNAIGLVIPRVLHRYVDNFWLEFIGGVTSACTETSYDLLLTTGQDLQAEYGHYRRLVLSRRVDGVILCDLRVRDPRISFLRESNARFVAFGRILGYDDFSWVDVDGAAGMREAVEHLLDLGHTRIAYLGTGRDLSFSHFRHEGYMGALLAHNVQYDAHLVVQDLDVQSDLQEQLTRLLALRNPPTALITCADFLAAAALRVLRQLGVAVPADISVVTFDDTLVTQHSEPELTSIRQDNRMIGESVAGLLFHALEDDAAPSVHMLVQPNLVVRNSTAPPHTPAT